MDTQSPKKTKTKIYQRVEYSIFDNAVRTLKSTENDVCSAMGYSPSSWKDWKKAGKMPKVAAVACEGLTRRQGKNIDSTYLLMVAGGEIKLRCISGALEKITLKGTDYFLVPCS